MRKRNFSQERRTELASEGKALPGGGFPIPDRDALRRAIMAFGRAKDKVATKAHIIRRARTMGLAGMLPSSWVQKSEGWSLDGDGELEFTKHGDDTHEEKSHGNWARAGSRETIRGPEGSKVGSRPAADTKIGHFNSAKVKWSQKGTKKGTDIKGAKGTEAELNAAAKPLREKMIAAAKTSGQWSQKWEDRVTASDKVWANRLGSDTNPRAVKQRATTKEQRRARLRANPRLAHLAPSGRAARRGLDAGQVNALNRRIQARKHGGHEDQSVHGNWSRGGSRANITEAGATFTGFIDPDTGEVFGMDEARDRRRSLMRKHRADHDEKSHGNRASARGGARSSGMSMKQIDARMRAIRRETGLLEPKGHAEFNALRQERGRLIMRKPAKPARITQSD